MKYWNFLLKLYGEFKLLFEPMVVLVIGIFTIIVTKNSNKYAVARERVEYVYHPLFISIEPYLYKNVSPTEVEPFLEKFKELDAKYSFLIYPSLRQHIALFVNQNETVPSFDLSNSEWFLICDYICNDYDKLCRIAHLPVRSTAYRLNTRQYKTKFALIIATLKMLLPNIIIVTICIALVFPTLIPVLYIGVIIFLLYNLFNSV